MIRDSQTVVTLSDYRPPKTTGDESYASQMRGYDFEWAELWGK